MASHHIPQNPQRDAAQSVLLSRQTKGGRQLWYQLTVLQQPERARACGAGTKANSDRRPVDPPPVVELRIKEGLSYEDGKEITFDYNASFFLYASLEQSRKIAPGRMQGQPNPPILTGVPASGMAYLDRPSAAGYFIFPDLSVRHEGQYRLSFSLFETTKEEKDYDLEPADGNLPTGVDWRMEIKTSPFDVFSAKKFPGLMESTALSKEVADQGCRVRIRRDVRMRKRDGKGGGHDRREEGYSRRRTVTPATEDRNAAVARARSISNSSEQRVPYAAEAPRRPSIVDYQAGPPPPPPGPAPYEPAGHGGHLSFGGVDYAHPRHYAQPPAPEMPSASYPPMPQYAKAEVSPYPYGPSSRSGLPPPLSPAPRQHEQDRRPPMPYGAPPPTSPYSTSSHVSHASHASHSHGHYRQDSHPSSYPSTPAVASYTQPPARAEYGSSAAAVSLPPINTPINSHPPSNRMNINVLCDDAQRSQGSSMLPLPSLTKSVCYHPTTIEAEPIVNTPSAYMPPTTKKRKQEGYSHHRLTDHQRPNDPYAYPTGMGSFLRADGSESEISMPRYR